MVELGFLGEDFSHWERAQSKASLLHIKRSQVGWFSICHLDEVFQACATTDPEAEGHIGKFISLSPLSCGKASRRSQRWLWRVRSALAADSDKYDKYQKLDR